jgi:uncharacterized membrane protein YfcA
MQFIEHFDGLHAIAGLLVGLLVGLTGVGGGSLMTPLLVLMFGVNPQTAVGTDLLYASITKTTGSAVHGWRETVDWKIVRRLAYGSVPAALITLAVLAQTGKVNPATQHVILVALSVLLALTALTVLFRGWLLRFAGEMDPMKPRSKVVAATVLLGVVMGVTVTVSSVGAGAIGVTVLLMLYPRLPVVKVVGSDIAHAVPLTLVAGLGHWMIGDVNGVLLANLLVGSIPGVIVGSLLSTHAPDKVLRPLLAAVLVVSAWQLYLKTQKTEGEKPKSVATASASAK